MAKVIKTLNEKETKLKELKERFEKNYGKGTIISGLNIEKYDVISTGSYKFNKITNCGGIPR